MPPKGRNANMVERYGSLWYPHQTALSVEMEAIRMGGKWKSRTTGKMCGLGLFEHYKRMITIIWPNYVWHRWNELQLKCWLEYRIIGTMGPASCVAGHTRIEDPITGERPTIQYLCDNRIAPMVMTLCGPKRATVPFVKGVAELFEVTLSSGERFVSTAGHLALFASGEFQPVGHAYGERLLGYDDARYRSTLDIFQSVHVLDALSSPRTIRGYQSGCPAYSCSGDERLLHPGACDRGVEPSRAGAQAHSRSFWPSDVLIGEGLCNHLYPHSSHPSTGYCAPLSRTPETFWSPHSSLGTDGRGSCLFQLLDLLQLEKRHQHSFSEQAPDCVHTHYGCEASHPHAPGIHEPSSQSFLSSLQLPEEETHRHTFSKQDHDSGSRLIGCGSLLDSLAQRKVVASINPVGRGIYYDLQVPDAHHYFAEGAIHHNSGKTNAAAVFALADYYVYPDCTTVLVSSTERELLEMRVWGEIKSYHNIAKAFDSTIPGELIESRQRIVTDGRQAFTDEGRDFRNGVTGVPLKKGGNYQGLGSFAGIKNKRVRMIADELHLCPNVFVQAIANLNKNTEFRCLGIGNPKDTTDALGILCEPSAEIGGWDSGIDQTPKTKTWPTRFEKGICIQLPGSDCPNMDVPEGDPVPYPFLITREAIAADVKFYGADSLMFTMFNEGRMPRGQGARRVITRQMCQKFGAMEKGVWMNENHTKIAFLDAAYGAVGGDRCMFGELWFGKDPNDKEILEVKDMQLVPVSVNNPELPEDQIALWVKAQCEARQIPPENFFFDSTGRGTLVGAFARLWNPNVGLVEFGGKPSERYVSDGIKVYCKDYYFNFVTELWYSVAYTIQSGQFRGLTEDLLAEGSMREWGFTGKNKIQVEPKDKMKPKTGRSPDAFDALVCGVEGARRRGFVIQRLMLSNPNFQNNAWRNRYADRMETMAGRHSLNY